MSHIRTIAAAAVLTATTIFAAPAATAAETTTASVEPKAGPGWTYQQRFTVVPHGGVSCAMFGSTWQLRHRWDAYRCDFDGWYFNLWVLNGKWGPQHHHRARPARPGRARPIW